MRLDAGHRPLLVDFTAAVILTAFTQYEIWTYDRVTEPVEAQSACFAVATVSLIARRRAPLIALALASSALTVQTLALGEAPVAGGFIALLALTYAVAAHCSLTQALAGLAVLAAAVVAQPVADPKARSAAEATGNVAIFALLWAAGRLVREFRQRSISWERRAETLERGQEEQVRTALADERQRIARELHDVVAHSVSVMVLQAGAARQHLGLNPESARKPLLVIEQVGREAQMELHRLLQVLRREGEERAPLAGLDHLDRLVEQVREAGLTVQLRVSGTPQQLSPGLDLTAYRVVQEALTNVLKHAPAARTQVQVLYNDRELTLAVTDDGTDALLREHDAMSGHGLIGMRERVQLYGGCLQAGPSSDGGFAVRARLPLVRAAAHS